MGVGTAEIREIPKDAPENSLWFSTDKFFFDRKFR